jgi:hypothetical protein
MAPTTFTERTAWRQAVAQIAAKAHEKLPECNGRIDSAVKLVLAGDVALLADGTAKVASRSNGTVQYHIANGHCDCMDYPRAPHQFCTHRLSAAIARRTAELVSPPPEPQIPPGSPAPLPEAPASVNCHLVIGGRQVQLTLRDTDETRLLARLEVVLQRFPLPGVEASGQSTEQAKGWCHRHQTQMKLNHGKDGRSWYSHKLPDGWCKGR